MVLVLVVGKLVVVDILVVGILVVGMVVGTVLGMVLVLC